MRRELVVDIYEGRRLVVRHVFFGRTRAEAEHVLDSHRKADKFLRECMDKSVYAGRVSCHAHAYWIR